MPATATDSERLDIRHASKTFGSRAVLRDVNLTIRPGEIQGVVGQNGSGKSTLAKIISGYHAPDRGTELFVDGEVLALPVRLTDLHAAGVSIVYQDLGLLPDRDVVTNVRVGAVRGSSIFRRINWSDETDKAEQTLSRLGFRASMDTAIEDLAPADRARVAIARALQERHPGRGLIVFDESTRALPEDALVEFYATIRAIVDEGTSALIIGHRLSEILEHCDRVSVLRDGQCVASGVPTTGLRESELAATMIGRDLAQLQFEPRQPSDTAAARVVGLAGQGLSASFDLTIAQGEIVGITGLPGSGYEQIPYLLSGAAEPTGGVLELGSERLNLTSLRMAEMTRHGVVLVPEGRLSEGLCRDQSVQDNIALPWLDLHGRPWFIGRAWPTRETRTVLNDLDVVPKDPKLPVGRLSGGNQQKVLLGKWLVGQPKLLVLHEPTQAVDVKARQDILEAIHKIAVAGTPVLIASSEATDLALLCDRIVTIRDGAVDDVLTGPCDDRHILDTIYRRETNDD